MYKWCLFNSSNIVFDTTEYSWKPYILSFKNVAVFAAFNIVAQNETKFYIFTASKKINEKHFTMEDEWKTSSNNNNIILLYP